MTRARRPQDAPTAEDRELARVAAAALREAIADPCTMRAEAVMHVDYGRPRCAEWVTTWANLPGFVRTIGAEGRRYTHALLPGWQYARHEVRAEMIPDLEALAERGVRPSAPTRNQDRR